MSLVSDSDFLIHRIRLSYLRNVDDPYGPRLISLSPTYNLNRYITAASLADVSKWPELDAPTSPNLSEDDGERPSGFPGATGLKHTQTIMGAKSGAVGLRVSGSRRSTAFNRPPRRQATKNSGLLSNSNDTSNNSTNTPSTWTITPVMSPKTVEQDDGMDAGITVQVDKPSDSMLSLPPSDDLEHLVVPPADVPPAAVVQFIPPFKAAADMEERRRRRMVLRNPRTVEFLPPQPATHPNPEISSSSSSSSSSTGMMDDDSSDDMASGAGEIVDDEFDPDFAATRSPGVNSDSASEVLSLLSGANSVPSTSNSLIPPSAFNTSNTRTRLRLSPVNESRARKDRATSKRTTDKPADSNVDASGPLPKLEHQPTHTHRKSNGRHKSTTHPHPAPVQAPELTFARCKVQPIRPLKSALTAMLASSESSSNPFAENYAAISGRAETASMTVQVYFPHAIEPAGKSMHLNVRKDATIEAVIGFALWSYWEAGWSPRLDDGLGSADAAKKEAKLTTAGWIMRIAEDDGEVDDEFPPPDRTSKVSKFNFDAYAILEASPAQFQQNQILERKIQRRPSRTVVNKKPEQPAQRGLSVPTPAPRTATNNIIGSMLTSTPLSTSLGPSSNHGPQIFLRIRIAETADAVHISTTIPVSAGMYMQEALELVCRKRKFPNPRDYALLLSDKDDKGEKSFLVPLDRTVASLQGRSELVLVKRSMLPALGIDVIRVSQKTTDPNASIFKRMSVPEEQASPLDYTAAYKKFVIYRRMPMMVTRQERTLAIDGGYVHIMPATNKAKAVFDNIKTFSYHISSIADCQQSTRSPSTFKLVVNRDSVMKRYDFEAENPKCASEIVQTLKSLKAAVERSGSGNKSRRSRQVG